MKYMQKKALVIGYGSIGKRHAGILQSMDVISEVNVLSRQENLPYRTIRSLDEVKELDSDYIVIASNTSLHFEQLRFLEENFQGKTILVEKPLFYRSHNFSIQNNSIWVGYNLRFYPIMQLIKEKITDKNLWNVHVFCGSYLPDWRPGRNYRTTASAKKEKGGGVLLDLSHELDYVQWLTGTIELEHVKSKKVSDLEIETEDLLLLAGRSDGGAHVHISLNYFTRRPMRRIIIDGEGISIQADLTTQTVSVYEDESLSEFAWPELERNSSYLAQHKAIITGDHSSVCTYKEGLEIMRLIDSIRSFNDG